MEAIKEVRAEGKMKSSETITLVNKLNNNFLSTSGIEVGEGRRKTCGLGVVHTRLPKNTHYQKTHASSCPLLGFSHSLEIKGILSENFKTIIKLTFNQS